MARKITAQEYCTFCEAQPCECDTEHRPRKLRKEVQQGVRAEGDQQDPQ